MNRSLVKKLQGKYLHTVPFLRELAKLMKTNLQYKDNKNSYSKIRSNKTKCKMFMLFKVHRILQITIKEY